MQELPNMANAVMSQHAILYGCSESSFQSECQKYKGDMESM